MSQTPECGQSRAPSTPPAKATSLRQHPPLTEIVSQSPVPPCADESDEELEGYRGALYKRKDFLGVEEEGERAGRAGKPRRGAQRT
jgi:hypothetical protein